MPIHRQVLWELRDEPNVRAYFADMDNMHKVTLGAKNEDQLRKVMALQPGARCIDVFSEWEHTHPRGRGPPRSQPYSQSPQTIKAELVRDVCIKVAESTEFSGCAVLKDFRQRGCVTDNGSSSYEPLLKREPENLQCRCLKSCRRMEWSTGYGSSSPKDMPRLSRQCPTPEERFPHSSKSSSS